MEQSFKYNGLTITVRAQTGLDMIDNPVYNRMVVDYVMGEPGVLASKIPPITWNRITSYVEMLQVSTVTGKGLDWPLPDASQEEIGEGYDRWVTFVSEHPRCYKQWDDLINTVNKAIPAPQPQSDGGSSESG